MPNGEGDTGQLHGVAVLVKNELRGDEPLLLALPLYPSYVSCLPYSYETDNNGHDVRTGELFASSALYLTKDSSWLQGVEMPDVSPLQGRRQPETAPN